MVTGYSPYQLVHGRTRRGPLETIKDGWIGGEISFQSSQAWVCEMRKRLDELFKVANSQEMKAKRKTKDLYDLNTQPRQLEPGQLVLCHTPGLTSKLHGIWEGSFEVLDKMSECNYVISVPSKRYTKQTVHINCLKK